MTKNFGQDFDHPSSEGQKRSAYKLLPKVVDFVIPILLGLAAALYVGKHWLGV
jgi:hypothetical protein